MKEKLERIYRPTYSKWAIEPDGKVLVGYKYNGYEIEIEEDFDGTRGLYGTSHKWYHTTLKDGTKTCSDRLYEIKQKIENDLKEEL